ncbi:hypothetical protein FWF93_00750 [Candidatus Saccharibacteria bacterium]|nr:hypothetical protein [Candidatus Saccharibacteria bacterium]
MDTGNSFGGGSPEINNSSQEQAPNAFAGFEQLPKPQNIEAPIQAGNETEQAVSNQEAQPGALQPQPQLAPPPAETSPASAQPQPQTNPNEKAPTVAGHANRIEKAWVEKGNAIIQETKDDPHAQKQRFDDLKDEYRSVRYGEGNKAA